MRYEQMYNVSEHSFELFYICVLYTMNSFSFHVFMFNKLFVAYFCLFVMRVLNLHDGFKMLISVLAFVENISIFKLVFINYEDGSQGKIALLLMKL